ncbi:polysaccharide deacetylase family protein [Bacillus thuringiensis]|uniref:polysaccharide deacetylase family protein n=1 Tax=Bacillus thuringiensis TaxID=1428 RepID=UPI003D331D52
MINSNQKKISKITGKKVYILSYPFGKFNDISLNQAKKYYRYTVAMGHDSKWKFMFMVR